MSSVSGTPKNVNSHLPLEKSKKKKPKDSKKVKAETVAVDKALLTGAVAAAVETAVAGAATEAAEDPLAGAKEIPGLFKILKKDDQVLMSISPDQLNKPFFFSSNVSKSLGERRLVGSEMGDSQLAEFRRVGERVQLVALHTENFAEPGSPQEKFVEEDYADSLISSAAAAPGSDPEGDVLVDAAELLFTDISGYTARMQRAYDTKFGFDVDNTSFTAVDNSARQTSFGVQAHFVASLATPGDLPSTTPVANSALTEFRYNFLKLPDNPMKPRLADERIGHFVTTRKDYTGDVGDGKVRYVNRWRLEKKDPDAAMSKPVKPITYWVANDVPEKYKESVEAGVLEWNKAFEAIGFKDAIVVKHQKATDTFDTLDAEHASVRWYTAADVGSAVGPSHVDPRTGEILDADIRMADVFGRSAQKFLVDNPPEADGHLHDGHACQYQHHASIEQQFASGLLMARGDVDANQELANAYIKDVVMHEVGHTLGLRHNFKGSTVFSKEQLTDAEFTKENGLGSSVMDYHPFNLAEKGEKQGEYVMSTLGAYDFLAVKYAYQPIEESAEADTLNEIARLTTTDPKLIYETDEAADDMDPEVSRFDLTNNPLEFAAKTVRLANELWDRAQTQELPEGTSYKELTKAFGAGLSKVAGAARLMTRYVGGVNIRRDRAGTEHAIYTPISAEKQRGAVDLITKTMFQPDSFKFEPKFVSRMAKERFGNWGDQNVHPGQRVTRVQARALKGLLDNDIAQRLIDNPEKLEEGTPVYKLSDLYQTLQTNIWSELPKGAEISQSRRDLQREYVKAVVPMLSPEGSAPGEARSIMRYLTGKLQSEIDAALKGEMSLEKRAHLEDVSQTFSQALDPKE